MASIYDDIFAPSNPIGGGPRTPTPTVPPVAGPQGSAIDRYLEYLESQKKPQNWADLGSILGSFSEAQRANRTSGAQGELGFDEMMLGREAEMNRMRLLAEQDRRASESDAMNKLKSAGFIQRGGASQYQSPTISIRGESAQLPGLARPKPTDAETQAATTLQAQMLERLQPGKGFQPTFDYTPRSRDERNQGPGLAEKLGSYGALGAGAMGALGGLFGSSPSEALAKMGPAGSKIAGLMGNYAPYAAAIPLATGAGGKIGGALSGAGLGAKIGSMFAPGLGTALGAGIGAAGGFIRGLFGGKKK